MLLGTLAAMAAFTLLAPTAHGDGRLFQVADGAAQCGAALGDTGKPITPAQPLTEADRKALLAALFITLHDPTVDDVRALPADSCPVARFGADDVVWTIHGGRGAQPLRWVSTSARPDWFFLVPGPSLPDAAAWDATRQGLPRLSTAPAYYLVGVADGINFLLQAYDGPPSMRRMSDDIAALLEGGAAPLAAHDPTGDVVSLFLTTVSGPQAEVFRPTELDDGRVGGLFMPDDGLVRLGDGGAFVFRGSDFACRPDYGPLTRFRVGVGLPQDDGRELSCQLRSDDVVMTVIVSHRPDGSADKAIWADEIRNAEETYGVRTKLRGPPTGRGSPIGAGRTWIDSDGLVQLVLFLRDGEYVYEIRQSHRDEAIEAAMAALKQVVDQISASRAP